MLALDERGVASLDGEWEFFPGDYQLSELDSVPPHPITVPGLWEAQGWVDLDGVAWYRRGFELADAAGWWSLSFGAVMDVAEVWLNGRHIGSHDNPFTPFTLDPTAQLRAGANTLCVRVFDPAADDPAHTRLPHGKQGWANHVFPNRPSLSMTYGGIWQPVQLRRHGPLVLDDLWVRGDPADVRIRMAITNRSGRPRQGTLSLRTLGRMHTEILAVAAGSAVCREARLGATDARRWSPDSPVLHEALADVLADGQLSDQRAVRFGLRTFAADGRRLLLNGQPFRMKSALVQGFRAAQLYAEGDRAAIEQEVRVAREMGFNTLRLHLKAFDPRYLDVCDELGMLLHCDIPVAEPIEHAELGAGGETDVASRAVRAVREQIRRDRNHPSIVVWSLMNELGLDRPEIRGWDRYERFARALAAAAKQADPTRPVIENDWVEPDPRRVFCGDILTAHYHGRLHASYLAWLEAECAKAAGLDRPFLVTEFGDWGLPEMPAVPEPPFWDSRAAYAEGLGASRWPGTVSRFIRETHRYQGLSDRLQAEMFRRHDAIGGYCLAELTDVPQEWNGLLDIDRQPKPSAVAEITRVNQAVLPMLALPSLVAVAGEPVTAALHVANDGPPITGVTVEVRFGDSGGPLAMQELLELETAGLPARTALARFREPATGLRLDRLEGYRPTEIGAVTVTAPAVPGSHDLIVRLTGRGVAPAENGYQMHVVAPPRAAVTARVLGEGGRLPAALEAVGAAEGDAGVAIVSEGALDPHSRDQARALLNDGAVVVILAQPAAAGELYPVPFLLSAVQTQASVFHFTTGHGAIPSLPRRNLLAGEDSTVQAEAIVTGVGGEAFPQAPVVITYKPVPNPITGTVLGSHPAASGRLVFCQYQLCAGAAAGDAAARALLADLLRWAACPRRTLTAQEARLPDGRRVARYWHRETRAS